MSSSVDLAKFSQTQLHVIEKFICIYSQTVINYYFSVDFFSRAAM